MTGAGVVSVAGGCDVVVTVVNATVNATVVRLPQTVSQARHTQHWWVGVAGDASLTFTAAGRDAEATLVLEARRDDTNRWGDVTAPASATLAAASTAATRCRASSRRSTSLLAMEQQ